MNRTEFGAAFQQSGEVTVSQLRELVSSGMGGTPEGAALSVLDAALLEFSRVRPNVLTTASAAWAGAAVALTGWYALSELVYIESPVGSHPLTALLPAQYELDTEAGTLFLIGVDSGTAYRVRYTALHTIPAMPTDNTAPTPISIPDAVHPAYFKLAAAHVFDRLASRYAETTGSAFPADSVSYQTKTGEYTKLAKLARAAFRSALGVREENNIGYAGFQVEIATPDYRVMPEASN